MDEALRYDRLLLMRARRIIADTTPRAASTTPAPDPDAAVPGARRTHEAAHPKLRREATAVNAPAPSPPPPRATASSATTTAPVALCSSRQHPDRALRLALRRSEGVFRPSAADPGALPVHDNVPHHERQRRCGSAARDPRSADDDAARRGDFIAGYALAFGAAAVLQALDHRRLRGGDMPTRGRGTALADRPRRRRRRDPRNVTRLLASAFARTEFQAVQFMPLIVSPQIILGDIFMPREEMPDVLYANLELPAAQLRDRRRQHHNHGDEGWDVVGTACSSCSDSSLGRDRPGGADLAAPDAVGRAIGTP